MRKAHAALLLPLLVGACAGTFSGSGAARLESPVAGRGGEPAALRADPVGSWRSAPGVWVVGARYAPSASFETARAPLLHHRLAAEAGSARSAGLHPYGRLHLEYGTVRAGEVPAEGFEATPQPELLRSWGVRLDAGVRGQLTRRTSLHAGAGVDRSAGLGESAVSLPELTRTHSSVRVSHHRSRSTRLEAGVQASHVALAESALLFETDLRATHQFSTALAVFAAAGGAAARQPGARAEARPIATAGATYTSTDAARSASASLGTRPEFDRLDGTLRQRLHGQLAVNAHLGGEARLALRVQGTGDLPGAEEARRLFSADLSLSTRVGQQWRGELGVRAFVQDGARLHGVTPAPSRSRLYFGFARRFD
jgi:hypothetical protein